VWLFLAVCVAWFVADIAVKPAASTFLMRDVSKAELVDAA
jgi:hypothetical protein